MNAKLKIVFVLFLLLAVFVNAQQVLHEHNGRLFSCKYHITSGMLNGPYVSYYKNGAKKSEGTFQYNSRIGEWSVWDSTGKLRVKRIYTNPYEYKQTFPVVTSEGPIPILSEPVYKIERDSLGLWKYYKLEQRMIAYSQRNFKCFYTSEKQLFFDCKTLFEVLYSNARKKKYAIYIGKKGNEDDTYSSRFDLATADSSLVDSSKIKLVGFRIKSDFVFDNARLLGEDRTLFITPLVVDKINPKDTFDLFHVYYPHARKYLSQVKINYSGIPNCVQNLDDVFFFSYFKIDKWNVSNSNDRELNEYVNTSTTNANSRLLREVETENDLWLYFNK